MKVGDTFAKIGKGIGGLLLVGAFFAVGGMIAALFIVGAARVSAMLLPWFTILTWVALGVIVFVILPLAIPRATRNFAATVLFISSFVFGFTLWMAGFVLTLSIWGIWPLLIGLFMMGVGVVPIAMLATLVNGMWSSLLSLILLAIMTFGGRAGALVLSETLGP